MDIHVQHLASLYWICGDKIKDHKRKVETNRFAFEIHQIWKDLLLLDSPNVHPQLKKIKERRQIPTVNNVLSLLIEHALIMWDKIETLQVRQQAKKAPDAWSQHETTKKQRRKINKFELLFILVMMTGSLILVL